MQTGLIKVVTKCGKSILRNHMLIKVVDSFLPQELCPTCLQSGRFHSLLAWLFLLISCCRSAALSACSAWTLNGRRYDKGGGLRCK